jgi:hypothetical protein
MLSDVISPDVIQWLTDVLNTEMCSIQRMAGATSSSLYLVMVNQKGNNSKFVLRLFTNEEWLGNEPDLATHEAASLEKAKETNVPVPQLTACDEIGECCGVPAILMSYLPGYVELKPADFDSWLYQIAETLFAIHSVNADDYHWKYFNWTETDDLKPPSWSEHPELWKHAFDVVLGPEPDEQSCFLHRDYHPTNILWQNGQVSGVVDWVNACCGPAGVDLAHCRGNLVPLYGVDVADRFLEIYIELAGGNFYYHPYWDINILVGKLPGPPDVYPPWIEFGVRNLNHHLIIKRHDEFLVRAVSRIFDGV